MGAALEARVGEPYAKHELPPFIRSKPDLAHIRTRHHAPETNGMMERFNESLEYEHLYREEIADAVALDPEVEGFRQIYNAIRPHEALGFSTPTSVHVGEPNP